MKTKHNPLLAKWSPRIPKPPDKIESYLVKDPAQDVERVSRLISAHTNIKSARLLLDKNSKFTFLYRGLETMKNLEGALLSSSLKILDLTNKDLKNIIKKQTSEEEFKGIQEQITLKEWIPDTHAAALLDSIKECRSSYRFLRDLSRKSVIPHGQFDSALDHNILTIEGILINFLNTLEFNGPLITNEYYERTAALTVVTPILSHLFMKFRSFSTKWFEIQTNSTNRHLFDGVIFYDGMNEPMALAEFGGPKCSDDKMKGDTTKVYRNAMRVLNEIAAKTMYSSIPRVYIVLFHKGVLRFETLSLIDNQVYVRNRHARIQSPRTPEELKLVFPELKKAIPWRDSLVSSIVNIHNDSSEGASPETSLVCSTL